ncbi:HER206Wp [Eremothecium sinecaudum]|uniref:rRNA-processing protein n=1 Tax=Eremothecium sinecaudum TaxID=45286 RepID=A0A0X8HU40_9SACH|nr:HER206Wp [Eremothecium sinecaudum]AMD21484.1 HER206Wp [Eremothecium sinecaudum]
MVSKLAMEAKMDDKKLTKGAPVSNRTWKVEKAPFRVNSSVVKNKEFTSWEKKHQLRLQDQQFKEKLKELKAEKEAAKQARIKALRDRREKKEENERYEKLAAKMHAKKVERMRKREKRNKALKER